MGLFVILAIGLILVYVAIKHRGKDFVLKVVLGQT